MRKNKFLLVFIFLTAVALIYTRFNHETSSTTQNLREKVYDFIQLESNQKQIYKAAMALNEGKSSNACVYFVSEVLRRNNIDISKGTCNTAQIISILERRGWRKDWDYKNLKPGDICFTTDFEGGKKGDPTHTFIFMSWVKEGSYDYAYICDNQAKDYDNKIYHIRNIKERVTQKGLTKDAFSFSMKPA